MPMVFRKHYPQCVVIIDYFEIFLDRPANLLARAQHILPQYCEIFDRYYTSRNSKLHFRWMGRKNKCDKNLTEHCSLLDNIVPGDTILADRGFDISDSVGFLCSKLELPAFTKGRAQLSGIEVEQTLNIANVRIHVEIFIGNIRK